MPIPFSEPTTGDRERDYLLQALADGHLSGDGRFTKAAQAWLEASTATRKALLTHSCTAALEMTALLADIKAGDEIIMPSFTFVSTANAFVLRGAVPVFVDIRPDTLNMDERLIEDAITQRTRAIVPVHYAGVACEMDEINALAARKGLLVIEDAAQGLGARYKNRALGSLGHFGALSFHASKNVIAGEGGALLLNDPSYAERAEIIREKGTNRSKFLRGMVDKYTWVDIGSSFLPGEITAALLLAQLEQSNDINARRLALWHAYQEMLGELENRGVVELAKVPAECSHNGHIFWAVFMQEGARAAAQAALRAAGFATTSHYVPLHSAPAGQKFARSSGSLAVTDRVAENVLRLPLYAHMPPSAVEAVASILLKL